MKFTKAQIELLAKNGFNTVNRDKTKAFQDSNGDWGIEVYNAGGVPKYRVMRRRPDGVYGWKTCCWVETRTLDKAFEEIHAEVSNARG